MAGIRLHHPTFRAAAGGTLTLVVELPQPYPRPYACPDCGKTHDRKAVHLRLDSNGDVIVAPAIFTRLQEVFLAGMEVVNEVSNQPPLRIGAVELPHREIVEVGLNDQASQRFHRPGRTKHESAARLLTDFRRVLAKEA